MRFITEDQIAAKAGRRNLTEEELRDAACTVAMKSAFVTDAIRMNDYSYLRELYRREQEDMAVRKAMQEWIKQHRAVFDPHRRKWFLLDDNYDEAIEAAGA